MKKILLLATILYGSFVNADNVIGEVYIYAMADGLRCDTSQIPKVTQAAIDAGLKEAQKICINPDILAIRILNVVPVACKSWNAGFRARAEVKFDCVH